MRADGYGYANEEKTHRHDSTGTRGPLPEPPAELMDG